MAEAVEKLGKLGCVRDNRIGNEANLHHCCLARRCHELMLRAGNLKIVFPIGRDRSEELAERYSQVLIFPH